MAEGRTTIGIARRLVATDRTVETEVGSILAMLGLAGSDEDIVGRWPCWPISVRKRPGELPAVGQVTGGQVAGGAPMGFGSGNAPAAMTPRASGVNRSTNCFVRASPRARQGRALALSVACSTS